MNDESVFQMLDHFTFSGISKLELNEIDGFTDERHNYYLLHAK